MWRNGGRGHACDTNTDHEELHQAFHADIVDEHPNAARILEELTTSSKPLRSKPPDRALSPLLALSVNNITNSVLPVSNICIGGTVVPALWDSGSVHNIASCGSMKDLLTEDDFPSRMHALPFCLQMGRVCARKDAS